MPELPEVETTKASLLPLLNQRVSHVMVYQASLRWAVPADLSRLVGQKLLSLHRRAKYIVAQFEQDGLLMHLGMSGSFRICETSAERRKHDHVVIQFENAQQHSIQLRYHDPRRFGCILWLEDDQQHPLLSKLGPEPLSDDFNAAYLTTKLQHKKTAIKVALMDNAIVVGVGNIYATESLFNTAIHPARPAHHITQAELAALVVEIKRILGNAIQLGGTTLHDYSNAQGENGYFQQTLLAYGRAGEMCVNCESTLKNIKLGQRASVFCPYCQPMNKA